MNDNMYENLPNPFDPEWYKNAFDEYISTADQISNTDAVIDGGYYISDADGSRSSLFRNNAVLNNTFNEETLRKSLKDIYLNSSHKLIASNHDNVRFFKWHGNMSDMKYIPNTSICQFKIPWNDFIGSNERDSFKLSQFYRKWIKIEEIANNWKLFKWYLILFINQKVYSEYEIYIDEQEVIIRFNYNEYWVSHNYPVFIYKFDTNFQHRTLISRELCSNIWNWKMPIDAVGDMNISNNSRIMVSFNKISDPNIRKDGLKNVEVLGDNLEFLEIKDGYIDLNPISIFNRNYIMSEMKEWLWMTITVPKFLHEYPILLPSDIIHRPYKPQLHALMTNKGDSIQNVKSNRDSGEVNQVYVDLNGQIFDRHDGWTEIIRPIVLSDAFENPTVEPLDLLIDEIRGLRDSVTSVAEITEGFHEYVAHSSVKDDGLNEWLDKISEAIETLYETQIAFYNKRMADGDVTFENLYRGEFSEAVEDIRNLGELSKWLNPSRSYEKDFWELCAEISDISYKLVEKHYVIEIVRGILRRHLWTDPNQFLGKVRFQRPIDESDFMIFEYDPNTYVWRPVPMKITRHFPDVYQLSDDKDSPHRIFKAFFFYSDTMNVLHESRDIERATPAWDNDIQKYYQDQGATYRDVFMEKFYWMGIRTIYKGMLATNTRWEIIEYILGNDSYERFNQLFLQTMDPYFKLGLTTYLKSSNFEFPFDDAISKFEEAVNLKWNNFKKITNFEMYLNNHWIPSYFDYITHIMDDWNFENRILRRPSHTFDMRKITPVLIEVQGEMLGASVDLFRDMEWVLKNLEKESYNLDASNLEEFRNLVKIVLDNFELAFKYITELDPEVYSIEDINKIINILNKYEELIVKIRNAISTIKGDIEENNIYQWKKDNIENIKKMIVLLMEDVDGITGTLVSLNMKNFMLSINDLNSYLDGRKTNPDDNSVIGQINKFNDPWTMAVKEKRNDLFLSTTYLNSSFDSSKSYTNEEVINFVELIRKVRTDISDFRKAVEFFWLTKGIDKDQTLIDKLDHTEKMIEDFDLNTETYYSARNKLVDRVNQIHELFDQFNFNKMDDIEKNFITDMGLNLAKIIENLSYLAGVNRKGEVDTAFSNINEIFDDWDAFVNHEEEVFIVLLGIAREPNHFIDVMEKNLSMIMALTEYMNSVNNVFIPDVCRPTYSEVFEIDEIEITSRGFRHANGDIIFIPNLGSYKITSVTGEISQAEQIEDSTGRRTTFKDPVSQLMPYGSVTNGNGAGFVVKALSSTRRVIINDNIIDNTIEKVQNMMTNISRFLVNPNPNNNIEYNVILGTISDIFNEWDKTGKIFQEYMTPSVYVEMDRVAAKFVSIIPPSEAFIEYRYKIDLRGFNTSFNTLIHDVYRYAESSGSANEEFNYWDAKIRVIHNSLELFIGSGTAWRDTEKAKSIVSDLKDCILIYMKHIIPVLPPSEEIDDLKIVINELDTKIISISVALDNFSSYAEPINDLINDIKSNIEYLYTLISPYDVWYRITNVQPTMRGKDYQVGDIVELLIPEEEGIFLQITKTEDGGVLEVQTMIDYALPFKVWGINEVITRTGEGKGLSVDVFSNEITPADSTLMNDIDDSANLMGEGDMILFKFENIHDLNINYEIFIGGHQVTNFVQRHVTVADPLHPKNIDVLYLNANNVLDLRNTSIDIPAEHYFVYKINEISIKDPGAGYAVGQDIIVDAEYYALRLKIASLINEPFKGIKDIDITGGHQYYKGLDPVGIDSKVVDDTMNNIDDEYTKTYYDLIPKEGIKKPATLSFDPDEYEFVSKRFDNLDGDDRNKNFMYPSVYTDDKTGDPDHGWYQGSRVDNSLVPMKHDKWNGIMNLNPPTDPFIPDDRRLPPSQIPQGEFQEIDRIRFHHTTLATGTDLADLEVATFADLPKHIHDWPEGAIGKTVAVEIDETNNGHRMIYRIRTFVAAGFFIYNIPYLADNNWNYIDINWMDVDWYPDPLSLKQQYPSAPWREAKSFRDIQEGISDGRIIQEIKPNKINRNTYIHNLTVDDLSVFNWTTKQWEDLRDETRWKLEVRDNPNSEDWGFRLTFFQDGDYSYDMRVYLNKVPTTQSKNAELPRNAIIDISSMIVDEVNIQARKYPVNTGRTIRIRKLFPYEQKETFILGYDEERNPLGYEMDFKLAPYIHYKNELHLADIKIFNKTANRFENVLDQSLFEIRFKDNRAKSRGFETETRIVQSIIARAGEGFSDGPVWGYNRELGIHIFGDITASLGEIGYITSFIPRHCPNPPTENIAIEFQVYQKPIQTELHMAVVIVEFKTERFEVFGDGYIHNVTNPMAPLPREFKIISQLHFDSKYEYEVIIDKTPRTWSFSENEWILSPTFHIPNYNIQQNRLYIMTDRGRFPLVNPSTMKPTLHATETENGTDVRFMNLYRRYEHIEVHSLPYPIRSVYVQRRVPSHGYINLDGKINKPLNKKYFEFWMNGRLLHDEVTIISPTKIIMHGLRSLRNFEIIEINRDSNEYFSDTFLDIKDITGTKSSRISNFWDYKTYLDAALEGNLEGDNYSLEEQEYLLTPVWPQVDENHPSFKDYPPNVDEEDDIILRVHSEDLPITGMDDSSYQFMMVDLPTLEGFQIAGSSMTWEQFGWLPLTDEDIIDMLNEEWAEEIATDPYLSAHVIIGEDEWYGTTARLYDEYGIQVHNLNDAVYYVHDFNIININTRKNSSKLIDAHPIYDLD